MNGNIRHIAIATGTRADWGLLSGIARALEARADCHVDILATNMHLSARYGATISEIEADGLRHVHRVEMDTDTDSPLRAVDAMAQCMRGMAEAFDRLGSDLVVILGDRFEMLATATAAMMMHVPIVHIAGGEISEGAIDDSIRHAITKLSALHLTATEPYRQRVINMGEQPDRVINTGAIGVWNILNTSLMDKEELERSIGLKLDRDTLLVTYHPATLDTGATPAQRAEALCAALDRFPGSNIIITYPNNDPLGRQIIPVIEAYGKANPGRVAVIPSLGRVRYLSALKYIGAVVGNSSSGIVEVPSMDIPTVDIGIRQRGRIAAEGVIHCGDSADEIAKAIGEALSAGGRLRAACAENPYYKPDTLSLIVKAIAETPIAELRTKTFYDRT